MSQSLVDAVTTWSGSAFQNLAVATDMLGYRYADCFRVSYSTVYSVRSIIQCTVDRGVIFLLHGVINKLGSLLGY